MYYSGFWITLLVSKILDNVKISYYENFLFKIMPCQEDPIKRKEKWWQSTFLNLKFQNGIK